MAVLFIGIFLLCWQLGAVAVAALFRFPLISNVFKSVSSVLYRLLLKLRYFVFDGERNYEIDFLRVLAVQLLDFSGFVCRLY